MMRMVALIRTSAARVPHLVLAAALTFAALPARAADAVTFGTVGSASANLWPLFIGLAKGFYTEENLKVDLIYIPSSAQVIQQLTAGSLDISISTGLVDPMRAIEKGAPLAVVRVDVQSPPYALVAKPEIKSLAELKGKLISVGGPKDITRIYLERMLAAKGVKPGDYDLVYAGATTARASALLGKAVDAAIILPPFNFQAMAQGFNELGLTVDYTPELPFSGSATSVAWANSHKDVLARVLKAGNRSVAWFEDDKNRAEAVKIMADASKTKPEEVEKSYDFFRAGRYFEATGTISQKRMQAVTSAMESLGEMPAGTDIKRFVLPSAEWSE